MMIKENPGYARRISSIAAALVLSVLSFSKAQALSLSLYGLTTLAVGGGSPPAAPGEGRPFAPLVVVDANGKVVGRFGEGGGEMHAYTTIDGKLVAIPFAENYITAAGAFTDFLGIAQKNVQFTSTDCSGTPYIHEGYGRGAGALRTATVQVDGKWRLYVAASMETQAVPLRSLLYKGSCSQIQNPIPAYTAFPANDPVDFTFTEPFTIR